MGLRAACSTAVSASCSRRPARKPSRSSALRVSFCSSSCLGSAGQGGHAPGVGRAGRAGEGAHEAAEPRSIATADDRGRGRAGSRVCRWWVLLRAAPRSQQAPSHLSLRGSSTSNSLPSRLEVSSQPAWPSCRRRAGAGGRHEGRHGAAVSGDRGGCTGQPSQHLWCQHGLWPARTRSSNAAAGPAERRRRLAAAPASSAARLPGAAAASGRPSFSARMVWSRGHALWGPWGTALEDCCARGLAGAARYPTAFRRCLIGVWAAEHFVFLCLCCARAAVHMQSHFRACSA